MYVWNENLIYPIIQILITILFNPSDHPYYTYDHPTNPEDNLIILTSILIFFANIWMILRIVPTILKHLLTKPMTIQSTPKTILSILRVTLPNLAMISLIWLVELLKCNRLSDSVTDRPGSREALASKTRPHRQG